jgi:DNA-binding NarL/FixJ family response regulator
VTIRILVVDDQPVVRAGVAMMIGTQPDLEVAGEAPDGLTAVSMAAELRPDVVVMDVRMPRLNGIEATRRVAALTPRPPRVVLLTTFDLDEYVFDGLLAGASGFLLKHAPPEEILLAVRAAAAGDALVSPGPMRRLVEHFVRGRPRQSAALDRLTDREREVFVLMVRGLSNAAIARTLVIGETTAKTHVTRILTKLQLRDRAHAVIYGYETGLVRPGEGGAPDEQWLLLSDSSGQPRPLPSHLRMSRDRRISSCGRYARPLATNIFSMVPRSRPRIRGCARMSVAS